MFFFLIFHTSISAHKDLDKKSLTTFFYGAILYIIFRAILNTSERPFILALKEYFWIIVALDIISMIYIYKTILDIRTGGNATSEVHSRILSFFENIADTSMYKTNLEIIDNNQPDNNNIPIPITTTPTCIVNTPTKKAVNFNLDSNTVKTYTKDEPLNSRHKPNNGTGADMLDTANEEDILINEELNSLALDFEQNVKPTNTIISGPNGNLTIPPPSATDKTGLPPPLETKKIGANIAVANYSSDINTDYKKIAEDPSITSTSIADIRKKALTPALETRKHTPPNINTKLNNKNTKYDPDDILNNIDYAKNTSTKQNTPGDNDDKYSAVSSISDIGSVLDFDLSEFADTL